MVVEVQTQKSDDMGDGVTAEASWLSVWSSRTSLGPFLRCSMDRTWIFPETYTFHQRKQEARNSHCDGWKQRQKVGGSWQSARNSARSSGVHGTGYRKDSNRMSSTAALSRFCQ